MSQHDQNVVREWTKEDIIEELKRLHQLGVVDIGKVTSMLKRADID